MKKIVVMLGIACFMLSGAAVTSAKDKKDKKDKAEKIVDVSQCTCEDMLNAHDEQLQKAALIWIDGYTSARSGDTRVSLHELEGLAKSLEHYCKRNPSTPILEAARKAKGR
ncbi:MAG: HdeA/HdeB family chaperone [Pseudomonadota bacterium]